MSDTEGKSREELASEHINTAKRYAYKWCRSTDRDWFRDEAESASLIGLAVALDKWNGSGSFSTLLWPFVRSACRWAFAEWRRDRSEQAGEDAKYVSPVGEPWQELSRAEDCRKVREIWTAIERRDIRKVRERDQCRAMKAVYGLGGLPAKSVERVSRELWRSPEWVRKATVGYVDEIRERFTTSDKEH